MYLHAVGAYNLLYSLHVRKRAIRSTSARLYYYAHTLTTCRLYVRLCVDHDSGSFSMELDSSMAEVRDL